MTGLPDRPAAELLAQWESLPLTYTGDREVHWQVFTRMYMDDVLERLARAEQALAAVSALTDKYGPHGYTRIAQDLRAALRASQGDSDV